MTHMRSQNGLQARNILIVSVPLIILVIIVSLVGLLYPQIYRAATPNWLAQSIGQDAIDLFLIVPVLIVGTLYSFSSHKYALYLWVGTLLYLVYTFLIYCFAVRFNPLFIPYCLILGISIFSVIWFFSNSKNSFYGNRQNKVLTIIGIYFITISVIFYSLWLMEVLPATFNDEVPQSVIDAGLFTNPVHVIDLSFILPATFMIGVMAVRRSIRSTLLAPILLTFFILMDLTIAALSVIMTIRNAGGSYAIAIVMTCLALFSTLLLVSFIRNDEQTV